MPQEIFEQSPFRAANALLTKCCIVITFFEPLMNQHLLKD